MWNQCPEHLPPIFNWYGSPTSSPRLLTASRAGCSRWGPLPNPRAGCPWLRPRWSSTPPARRSTTSSTTRLIEPVAEPAIALGSDLPAHGRGVRSTRARPRTGDRPLERILGKRPGRGNSRRLHSRLQRRAQALGRRPTLHGRLPGLESPAGNDARRRACGLGRLVGRDRLRALRRRDHRGQPLRGPRRLAHRDWSPGSGFKTWHSWVWLASRCNIAGSPSPRRIAPSFPSRGSSFWRWSRARGQLGGSPIRQPTPELVQKAVKTGILSLIWLNVGLVAAVRGLEPGGVITALWVPAYLLGRWLYTT